MALSNPQARGNAVTDRPPKAPAGNPISVDDVGIAVAFLAREAAKLITGETLYIDCGYHIVD